MKTKRCPNGTYRNKRTGICESKSKNLNSRKRCPNGTYRNKQTGNCEPKKHKQTKTQKRCPNGTYRNKKTGNCDPKRANNRKSFSIVSLTPTPTPSPIEREKEIKIIQRFMLKTTQKRRTHFLKSVCSDAGVCIAFGKETKKINDFFGGFTHFRHISGIKQIGAPSANGFVVEIQYSKDNYNAHTILKNSKSKSSDNLAYEYFVGQFINIQNKRFPCFLETYGLFVRNQPNLQFNTLFADQLSIISNNSEEKIYSISCKNSDRLSVLIQHISHAKTLSDKMLIPSFNKYELLFVLYQVYMPLMCLKNEFTHYDLHYNNVLLYEPIVGKYIQYHYFVDGTEITFKSRYIAKIIDYGRCFFHISDTKNSLQLQKQLCKDKECNPKCGNYFGYGWLNKNGFNKNNHFINSKEPNISHDLRLLQILKYYNRNYNFPSYLDKLLAKVNYVTLTGTNPNITSGIPNTINNVQDAYYMLETLVTHEIIQQQNEKFYENMTKLGDLYIFNEQNKPMQFNPNK